MMRGGSVISEEKVEYEPSSLAYSSAAIHLAVGDAKANLLRIYHVQDNGFDLVKEVQLTGCIQDLVYSPDQKYLATADSNRKVRLGRRL